MLNILGSAQKNATAIADSVATIHSRLDREKYSVEALFLDSSGPLQERFNKLGVRNHRVNWRHPHRDAIGFFSFSRFLNTHSYELVHFHWGGNLLQRLASRQSKVIVHLHARSNESHGTASVIFPTSHADAVIAISEAVAKCSTHPKTRVIYPGIEGRTAHHQPEGITIGTAGRLVRLKGTHIVLQALRLLSAEFPALRLEIAGAGPEEANLKNLAQSLGIASIVRFLGWQENLEAVFENWRIFVQPSLEEGLSLSLLQAMSIGMPVIGSAVGGIPEAVEDRVSGRLVQPGNAFALSDAIRELILSHEKSKAMGASAACKIKNKFSRERMITQVAAVYDEVLNARS